VDGHIDCRGTIHWPFLSPLWDIQVDVLQHADLAPANLLFWSKPAGSLVPLTIGTLARRMTKRWGIEDHKENYSGSKAHCGREKPGTLALVLSYMATPIPHFVSFEVRAIDTLCLFRFFTGFWHWALVAVGGMEMVIYMAPEVGWAMKPWAGANEDAANKPFGTVVAGGSTGVWGDVIVAVGTVRGYSDFDADLSLCFGSGNR
jgi:hypothetical protein